MKILIVDDEELIRNVIEEYCKNSLYDTDCASDGYSAIKKLNDNHYDLMILDIMMPHLDGFSMLKMLPLEKRVPTIMLSARDEEYDKLTGFQLGIDDYVTKPFSPKELMARVSAVLNRCSHNKLDIYKFKTLELNFSSHTLKIDKKVINITPKEYEILKYLVDNRNIAISRAQLLNKVWGYDFYGDDRTIDTHIKMLRNNLLQYRDNIVTVRGFGYKYIDED